MTLDLSKLNVGKTTPPAESKLTEPPPLDSKVIELKSFIVQLEGEPAVQIDGCVDRMDAQDKYNKQLGINHTIRKYTYTEVV